MQDHDRALIVGENSFGKGLVQNPFLLEYGSMLLLTIAKYETPSGRLLQRDYSNGNLYDYYSKGGSLGDETNQPKGSESKTDSGRTVYSGGGIMPDEIVKPNTIPIARYRQQQKILDPIFAFALDTTYGKVGGLDDYRVDRPITFNYDLKKGDFPTSDELFEKFKKFAVDVYKISPSLIDREREFVERALRTEIVTAAYGVTTSGQVSNIYDNQLLKAVELLPKARQLALEASKAKVKNDLK